LGWEGPHVFLIFGTKKQAGGCRGGWWHENHRFSGRCGFARIYPLTHFPPPPHPPPYPLGTLSRRLVQQGQYPYWGPFWGGNFSPGGEVAGFYPFFSTTTTNTMKHTQKKNNKQTKNQTGHLYTGQPGSPCFSEMGGV